MARKLGKIGVLLLAAWLILQGLTAFIDFRIDGSIMAVLALAAGVLLILDK